MSTLQEFIRSGTQFKNEHGWPTSSEAFYDHRDVVLLIDSSFTSGYDKGHLWAIYSWLMVKGISRAMGKRFRFHVPYAVVEEYNAFLQGKKRDKRGLPFARETLEELFGVVTYPSFSPKSIEQATPLARKAWEDSYREALRENGAKNGAAEQDAEPPKLRRAKLRRNLREGPTAADLSVLVDTIIVAEQRAEVYVASYDLRDIIKPLSYLKMQKIKPLPPSPIQLKYFQGSGLRLEAVVTDDVVSGLQSAVESETSFPVVVFETGVRSGDAVFDAGVGVLQQDYGMPLQLPPSYKGITKNHRIVPVARVDRLRKSALAAAKLNEAFKKHPGQQLLVFQYEHLFDPLLVKPSKPINPVWYNPFSVSMDFLRYQTNSVFARENFVPDSKKPQSLQLVTT